VPLWAELIDKDAFHSLALSHVLSHVRDNLPVRATVRPRSRTVTFGSKSLRLVGHHQPCTRDEYPSPDSLHSLASNFELRVAAVKVTRVASHRRLLS
jgi:hypothetical protein